MTKTEDKIAALEREIEKLKAAQAPPAFDTEANRKSTAQWASDMHAMRERNASVVPPWLRQAVGDGVTDADARDIVRASHAPKGPSSQGVIPASQQLSNVHAGGGANVPGGGTGWAREVPLGPQPGINHVDRLIDHQDAIDRAELVQRHNRAEPQS